MSASRTVNARWLLSLVACAAALAAAQPASAASPHVMSPAGRSAPTNGTGPLQYQRGRVQLQPTVYLDFWGPRWTDGTPDAAGYTGAVAQRYIEAFVRGIAGSAWFASQTQYCEDVEFASTSCPSGAEHVGIPSLGGVWNHTTAPVPTDAGIEAEANAAGDHFGVQTDNDATVVVLTPTGQGSFATDAGKPFCAYHAASSQPYAYVPWVPDAGAACATNAVNPSDDAFGHGHFDGFSIVVGHEIAEAATNALPGLPDFQGHKTFGWLDADQLETADKCQALSTWPATNLTFGANRFAVQPLWSNSTDSCPTEDLGGAATGRAAIASWAPDHRDVFVRGFDGALWTRRWNGSAWSGWSSLGGLISTDPTAVSWGPDRTDVFARGGDGALWHIAWAGGTWSGWQSLGGGMLFAPAASSWQANGLDVVVVGLDRAMWHLRWNGSAWSGWQSLGGGFSAAPSAVSWRDGSDRVDVFARGQDGQMWQNAFVGSWTGWLARGGGFGGGAAAASTAPGRLQVFGIGLDGGLWRQSWTGSAWTAWTSLGGAWGGDPAAVSPAAGNTVELAMTGVNRNTERLVTGP